MHITYSETKIHPILACVNKIFIGISSSHISENLNNNPLSYDNPEWYILEEPVASILRAKLLQLYSVTQKNGISNSY
jgi:hypothetical protein